MQRSDHAEEQAISDDAVQQFLTFMLGGDVYGIDILNIKEIIEYGNITQVPMMPPFIAGVINLRGSVVPVIDLAIRFAGAATEITKRTAVVILEVDDDDLKLEIGVMVDIVNEVLNIPAADIEPAPAFGAKIRTNFIRGMGKVNDQLLILLDIQHVLSIEELSVIQTMNV